MVGVTRTDEGEERADGDDADGELGQEDKGEKADDGVEGGLDAARSGLVKAEEGVEGPE
jgi:hypothetical protein